MPEPTARDRLQPSLLDRLIDDAPQHAREGSDGRVLTRQQLRAAVLRDLSWLFNAIRPEPDARSERLDEIEQIRPHDGKAVMVVNLAALQPPGAQSFN